MKLSKARFCPTPAVACGVVLTLAVLFAAQRARIGPAIRPTTAPSSRASGQAIDHGKSVSATASLNGMTLAYTGPMQVTAGEPVEVKIELRNDRPQGGREVWFLSSPREGAPIGIEIQTPSGRTVVSPLRAQGKGFVWMGSENGQLLTGGRVEGTKELSKVTDMKEPGEYLVSVVAGFDDPTFPNGYDRRHIKLWEIPIVVVQPKASAE